MTAPPSFVFGVRAVGRRIRRARRAVAQIVWAVGLLTGAGFSANAAPPVNFAPRALQLLQQMAAAYANCDALQQRTEFFSDFLPLAPEGAAAPAPSAAPNPTPPPADLPANSQPNLPDAPKKPTAQKIKRSLRLWFARPNRLRLESEDADPNTDRPLISKWISDGRTFWTYQAEKNWYTREKAPARFADFQRLAHLNSGSLELLMLMGVNPFAHLEDHADSLKTEGGETVRGVPTEVVVMRSSTPYETTEARFYIGKDDFLLRRVVTETTPIVKPPYPGKVGDALDELLDDPAAPPPAAPASPGAAPPASGPQTALAGKTRISYENILTERPLFDGQTFAYTPPADALRYGPSEEKGKPHRQIDDLIKAMKRAHSRSPRN